MKYDSIEHGALARVNCQLNEKSFAAATLPLNRISTIFCHVQGSYYETGSYCYFMHICCFFYF